MNNLTICPVCKARIGRADIEESKSNVALDAWLPQASYPCGNFSDISNVNFSTVRGSIGHAFTVRILTENQNKISFCPFTLREISVLTELILGHLCYRLTDVPPQPNSQPSNVFSKHRPKPCSLLKSRRLIVNHRVSATASEVMVFHWRFRSHLFYTL